jgi:mRNA interferase MazF
LQSSLHRSSTEVVRGKVFRLPAPRGARGHEQRGARYAVIVQADEFLDLSTSSHRRQRVPAQRASDHDHARASGDACSRRADHRRRSTPTRLVRRATRCARAPLRRQRAHARPRALRRLPELRPAARRSRARARRRRRACTSWPSSPGRRVRRARRSGQSASNWPGLRRERRQVGQMVLVEIEDAGCA